MMSGLVRLALRQRLDSVGRRIDVEAHARAVIRQQTYDRRIVVRDEHPRGLFGRPQFDDRGFGVGSLKFECRLPHVVAPVPDRRILVAKRSGISALSERDRN